MLSLAIATPVVLAFAPSAMAATACSGDPTQPAPEAVGGGWTLKVCLNIPDGGGTGTITADFPKITADPELTGGTGTKPRIQRMIFTLTGQGDSPDHDLLTDFTRDKDGNFSFVFPRHAYLGGTNLVFAVRAMMTGAADDTGVMARLPLSFVGNRQPLDPSFTLDKDGGRPPARGNPYVVAVTGDGAGGEPGAARVIKMIRGWNPNLLLYPGDVYNNGTQAEFYNHYGLSGKWGNFRDRTIPTIGNHESFYKPDDPAVAGDQSGFGYFNYWFGNNEDPSNHHFGFDAYRGWHIVSLDSTRAYLGPRGGRPQADDQVEFLREDLRENGPGCALVMYHHPRYSLGPETFDAEDRERLNAIWRPVADARADIVISAHDHNYQRWTRMNAAGQAKGNGTAQFIVGSGGHGIEQVEGKRDRRVRKLVDAERTFGAMRLVLNRYGAEYRYVTVDGRIRDIGVIPCSGRRADRLDRAKPTKPSLVAANKNGRNVTLRWRASTDVGGVGVTRYIVFRNGNRVGTTKRQVFTDRNAPRRLHRYTVKAVDYSGNKSWKSNVKRVRIR